MGTVVIGLMMVAVIAAIIINLVKGKKSGKSSCGGSCAHCSMGASCHSKNENSDSNLIFTVLEIEGMMCPMCESHINDAIRNNFSVKSVKSSHKTGLCQILSEKKLDEELIRKIIKESGYNLKKIMN